MRKGGHSLWSDGSTFWVSFVEEYESWDIDEDGRLVQLVGLDGKPQVDVVYHSKLMGTDRKTATKRFMEWLDSREAR